MAVKLSSRDQVKMTVLVEAGRKWDRVHALVEQLPSAGKSEEAFTSQIGRTAAQLSRLFLNGGFGTLSDSANQLAMIARRGGSTITKVRSMREIVGAVRGDLERREKALLAGEEKKEPAKAS